MTEPMQITMRASAPRRYFGLAMLAGLGGLLLYLALNGEGQAFGIKAFLIALGALALYVTQRMFRATEQAIILDETGLHSGDGEMIAEIDQIDRVDRGAFAFKPSNGFIVILKEAQKPRWEPGMWWRLGRRVGIGGVTGAAEAKAMAEVISGQILARQNSE
tara:strand:- start:29 stop:511 length:483 start_codon:yes stop_codon:yes gene_type:complete